VDNDGDGDTDEFDEILTPEFISNINNMHTVTYSPLAEGLSTIGYYLSSPSSGASGGYCQQNFTIVISPGVSSEDQGTPSQHVPASLSDYDGDNAAGDIAEGKIKENSTIYNIPVNQSGSTYLDDVAYYLYSNDIVADVPGTGSLCFDEYDAVTNPFFVGGTVTGDTSNATGSITAVNVNVGGASGCLELAAISGNFDDDEILTGSTGGSARVNGLLFDSGEGYQNVFTYTVGFMGDKEGDLFLINTSNNGNGKKNLYNTSDEEYGKYHFNADSPKDLSAQLLAAVNSILSRTSTFMAPVVPVTRTTSGNRIYMAFFKPNKGNYWEGNVTKYGILSNQIVDKYDQAATYDNGAMIETAEPFWSTIDWADNISFADRYIYTSLNGTDLIPFEDGNLTDANLGTPTSPRTDVINYARGADILDEDEDTVTLENRSIITGDVLHSEPVIFKYRYANGDSKTMVYFGANDGMLHAVLDTTQSSGADPVDHGTEEWAFIPPDLLPHIKDMIEGVDHQYYVDSTPKIYFKDIDGDGIVDSGDDQVILVCGERKGGTGYFALDVTNPSFPNVNVLWRINQNDYSATYGYTSPTHVIPELGQTWSEPQFGVVKDSFGNGIPVLFVGGGYDGSATPTKGNTVLVINVTNGDIVRQFNSSSDPVADMNYPIPSNVLVVDENENGYVDKVYVGDLGGQMWRLGGVTANDFQNFNENINDWTAQVLFKTDSGNSRKFFYPPSITFEKGFDMVFMGTGNREESCCNNRNNLCSFTGSDIIAAVKETHSSTPIMGVGGMDLVDVTDPTATPPNLTTDDGWYIRLVDDTDQAVGEKVLSENVVFYKTLYITTFLPNEDPCAPGGDSKLYALSYLTGQPVLDFDGNSSNDRSVTIGGGIPSKPVMLITKTGTRLLVSVGSSNPDPASPSTGAGIMNMQPLVPPINFFYKYWKEAF
jgi:type IV pilus assembly protein PilY1